MRLEQFFEKFELFVDVPGAVGRIRELVLQLAVQGKLVEQQTNETSAKECIYEASKPLIEITLDETIETPAGWLTLPLGCLIASNTGGGTPSKQNPEYWNGSIPWASVKDIQSDKYLVSTIDSITEKGLKNSSSNLIPPNRLIVVTRMGLGKLAINTIPVAINQDLRAIEMTGALDLDFAYLLFKSLKLVGSGVTVKGITVDKLHAMPVCMPPLAEQKRIVAKVDELMALCDRLEAQQQERETPHAALAHASLARFADAPTPANLKLLFHPSYTIPPADLRKTILTLAVQGKLVPQDPNDEPATDQLLTAANATPNAEMEIGEPTFSLPDNWCWLRIADVFEVAGGIQKTPHRAPRGNAFPYLSVGNVYRGWLDLTNVKKFELEPGELEHRRLEVGDLLIIEGNGSFNEIGRCAEWNGEIQNCVHQNHVIRCRPCDVQISSFVLLFLNSPDGTKIMQRLAITSSGLYSLSVGKVRQIEIPLPPLPEQRRIVAKVDQLMALVDQLEAHLATARVQGAALLDAAIHEVLHPKAEVVDLASYRAAIGCYAIARLHAQPTFGRVAAMKVLYLAETHVGLPLQLQPIRHAAGPYDEWIKHFTEQATQAGWFTVTEYTLTSRKTKYIYHPGPTLAEQTARAERLLTPAQRRELDRMLDLFAGKPTEEVEIIATLFAAWNDFLIDGYTPSDDEIVEEVREHWHESKQRFTPERLQQELGWLRQHELIPSGRAPSTRTQRRHADY